MQGGFRLQKIINKKNMKIYQSEKYGCVYWKWGNVLMFAPMSSKDSTIDLDDDGGEVETNEVPREYLNKVRGALDMPKRCLECGVSLMLDEEITQCVQCENA